MPILTENHRLQKRLSEELKFSFFLGVCDDCRRELISPTFFTRTMIVFSKRVMVARRVGGEAFTFILVLYIYFVGEDGTGRRQTLERRDTRERRARERRLNARLVCAACDAGRSRHPESLPTPPTRV